ncbi:hypothetical protein [Pedobacter punctiformis]|uniref:Uncharacterized protein n=1 Tax=Pedobacter punctiformis TaxID=3004097 RepID=A0ABT4LBK8_9SPHI|nr:hypothetical protein [Pedobacter sp. HCMS5-2]MCZ4245292.1 hypothetical protein [Pedobacter sp. HCMS5-2]
MKLLSLIFIFFTSICYSQNNIYKIAKTNCSIVKEGKLYGLIDENHKPVLLPKYVYYELSVNNRYIKLKSEEDKYTLYDLNERMVLQNDKHWIMFYNLKSGKINHAFFTVKNSGDGEIELYNDKNEMVRNLGSYDVSLQGKIVLELLC